MLLNHAYARIHSMMKKKHFVELKSLLSNGLDITESILCSIAFKKDPSPHLKNNRKAQQALFGLRRYKFIRRVGSSYAITPKGEKRLRHVFIDEVIIKNPKNWDGKWRLVIYDLPIKFRKARDAFRWKLKDLGFYQFQKSAWAYPHPCEGELLFVADFFGVRKHIDILEVNKISNEEKLKSHFKL